MNMDQRGRFLNLSEVRQRRDFMIELYLNKRTYVWKEIKEFLKEVKIFWIQYIRSRKVIVIDESIDLNKESDVFVEKI
jgi:hypothetical protein